MPWNRMVSGLGFEAVGSAQFAWLVSAFGIFSPASAGQGARCLISSNPLSIMALGKICSESELMSARKPSGCAAGLWDLNKGLKARTVALTGLL